jgi:hypothetical protein
MCQKPVNGEWDAFPSREVAAGSQEEGATE